MASPRSAGAYARLYRRFLGMTRLRKWPAYAGVHRLLDMGWTKRVKIPPEPPLINCADVARLTEEERPRASPSPWPPMPIVNNAGAAPGPAKDFAITQILKCVAATPSSPLRLVSMPDPLRPNA
jgi:hypothetical protein